MWLSYYIKTTYLLTYLNLEIYLVGLDDFIALLTGGRWTEREGANGRTGFRQGWSWKCTGLITWNWTESRSEWWSGYRCKCSSLLEERMKASEALARIRCQPCATIWTGQSCGCTSGWRGIGGTNLPSEWKHTKLRRWLRLGRSRSWRVTYSYRNIHKSRFEAFLRSLTSSKSPSTGGDGIIQQMKIDLTAGWTALLRCKLGQYNKVTMTTDGCHFKCMLQRWKYVRWSRGTCATVRKPDDHIKNPIGASKIITGSIVAWC